MLHPTAIELHNYYSRYREKNLSPEERLEIAFHVALCPECAAMQKEIQEHEVIWNNISLLTETEEESIAIGKELSRIQDFLNI